jgi:hypothetical protein
LWKNKVDKEFLWEPEKEFLRESKKEFLWESKKEFLWEAKKTAREHGKGRKNLGLIVDKCDPKRTGSSSVEGTKGLGPRKSSLAPR